MGLRESLRTEQSVWDIPKHDIVNDVMNPGFANSQEVFIMAGFYASSGIKQLSKGLSALIANSNGKLKIICSEYIGRKDIPNEDSEGIAYNIGKNLLTNAAALEDTLLTYTRQCISFLIREKRIEIKIAVPRDGMFHKKVFIFIDDIDGAVVMGSANFSIGGFRNNAEAMILGKTWEETKLQLNYLIHN